MAPHGFPWFMQAWAYNFCHISAGGEPDHLRATRDALWPAAAPYAHGQLHFGDRRRRTHTMIVNYQPGQGATGPENHDPCAVRLAASPTSTARLLVLWAVVFRGS